MDALQVLQDARSRITDRENWLIGSQGNGTGAHCALGAVGAAIGSNYYHGYDTDITPAALAVKRLASLVDRTQLEPDPYNCNTGTEANVVANYNNTNSHDCVIQWFDEAIAQEQEAINGHA